MVFLAITNSTNSKIKLINCNSQDEALNKMKVVYDKLCIGTYYDEDNSFLDEQEGYAQVVNGLEQTEIRIGETEDIFT